MDPDLPFNYNLPDEGRFSNIRTMPSLDKEPRKRRQPLRPSKRACPGLGSEVVRSNLSVAGAMTIRQTYHTPPEELA
jgi:hypothetical protein